MSDADREHWDLRYTEQGMAPSTPIVPSPVFARFDDLIPVSGTALELACGRGRAALWLASRGLEYVGVDVSPVAIDLATKLVGAAGLADRCRFEVHDLDLGLPGGEEVDLIFNYLFRQPDLDSQIVHRLRPGGTLAYACLSEVDHGPGSFRAKPGELTSAFGRLDIKEAGEADGMAWLVAQKT